MLALSDLEEIALNTRGEWSDRQARKYGLQLRTALIAILSGRETGRPFHLPHRTLRRVLVGKHHIYFERSDDLPFVSRVLHGAMNVYYLEFPAPLPLSPNE